MLERGWNDVLVPGSIAEDVEAGRALDASGRAWLAWLAAAVVLVLVAVAVIAARRVPGRRSAAAPRAEPA